MKKFLWLTITAILTISCYDDSELWNTVNDHETRIAKLETLCNQMNTNIISLQTIIASLQDKDYVVNVASITEGGKEIGYTITFSKSGSVTIYHGNDGADGKDGADGEDGEDGHTPVIGIAKDVDGIYYWTLDGEWLTDEQSNKIPTTGTDGSDGKAGTTPQLRIDNNYWYISYDNGKTWVVVDKATGEDGDSFFQSVTNDGRYVYLTLIDGTVLTIPMKSSNKLDIVFDNTNGLTCYPGSRVRVSYTIVNSNPSICIECFGDGGWSASVIKESNNSGVIEVTSPEYGTNGKVIVILTSEYDSTIMKTLYFEKGLLINILDSYEVDWEACTLEVDVETNLGYTINIPSDASQWISIINTRSSLRKENIVFSISENPDEMPRSSAIELLGPCGDVLKTFIITQKLQPYGDIEFADKYVKLVCVKKFDTNGDGEVSFKEALKVTKIEGGVTNGFFGEYKTVVESFDELQYFQNVQEISFGFMNCTNLRSIVIPQNVKIIQTGSFRGCNKLEKVIIPNSVTIIGSGTFEDCSSLTDVTISNKLESIENYVFEACSSLVNINFPESLSSVGVGSFKGCTGLITIDIPDNVTQIGGDAFYGCKSLTSVTIGSSVNLIGSAAFQYCSNLKEVYCKPITPPTGSKYMFDNNASDRIIYVHEDWVEAYKQFNNWNTYSSSIVGYNFY